MNLSLKIKSMFHVTDDVIFFFYKATLQVTVLDI